MIKASITGNGRPSVDIDIPENLRDVKLSQWIDFTIAASKLKQGDTIAQEVYDMGLCLAEYWRKDPMELYGIPVESTQSGNKYDAKEMKSHMTVKRLFNLIYDICFFKDHGYQMYQPEPDILTKGEYKFEYKGSEWTVSTFTVSEFNSKVMHPTVDFGSTVELLEAQRLYGLITDKDLDTMDESQRIAIENGSYKYRYMLAVVGNLARNASLDSKFRTIQEKIEYFCDIDVQTCLDLLFFSINSSINSKAMMN